MQRVPKNRLGLAALAVLTTAAALVVYGGLAAKPAVATSSKSKVTFGYVTQLSVAPYFVQEANGAKAEAKKLGVGIQVVDSGRVSSKVLSLTQTLITTGVKGVAIVPGDTAIGPRLSAITSAAHVPLVASDSPLKDAKGKPVPFVGMNNAQAGVQVGKIAGRIYKQLGWSASDTGFADVEVDLQACLLRTNAEVTAFRRLVPSFSSSNVVKVPYDGGATKAQDSMNATITAHPEIKHWVIASCNDDGVVGAARALQTKGFPVGNILGVGLGGNLACSTYKTPYLKQAMRATTWNDPGVLGATSIKLLYEMVVQHKKHIPAITYVATPEVNSTNYSKLINCANQK